MTATCARRTQYFGLAIYYSSITLDTVMGTVRLMISGRYWQMLFLGFCYLGSLCFFVFDAQADSFFKNNRITCRSVWVQDVALALRLARSESQTDQRTVLAKTPLFTWRSIGKYMHSMNYELEFQVSCGGNVAPWL